MSALTPLTDPRELAMQERAQALAARGDVVGATRLMDEFLASHDGDWGSWLYLAGLHARIGRTGPAVAAYQACARQLEGDGRHARAREALQQALRLEPGNAGLTQDIARLERQTHGLREVPPPPPAPSVPERVTPRRRAATAKDITTAVVARRATAPVALPAQPVSAPRAERPAVKTLRRSGTHPAHAPEAAKAPASPRRSGPKAGLAPEAAKVQAAPQPSAEQTYLMLPSVTESMTDPYIAIFDILDNDAKQERLRSARPRAVRRRETTPMLSLSRRAGR